MTAIMLDSYKHEVPQNAASQLTFGAVSTTAVGTISPTTSAGESPTTAAISGRIVTDRAGSFALSPVTGGGAQAAGKVVEFRFLQSYGVIPSAILVTIANFTDTTAAIVASANAAAVNGFGILVGTALTTAKVYHFNYLVIP